MAEDSDLERTEQPSQRRIDQAREDGDVPRSRELSTCLVLMAAGMGVWFMGDGMVRQLKGMLTSVLTLDRDTMYDPNILFTRIGGNVGELLLTFAPFALLLIVAAIASPLLIGGWLFSANALIPNFGKLNPIAGLGNMFSVRALVELLKAVGKSLLVGTVAWMVMSHQLDAMMGLTSESLQAGSDHVGHLLLTSFIAIVSSLVVIAMIDGPYQMWQYTNKLKMTRQELKQESKESDGNPEIKDRKSVG